jgi:drug/metabolite transporter (DMT)-like permease
MLIYFLIIGGLVLAGGTTLQKVILNKKADPKKYQVIEFLGIIIVMIPLIFFFWKLEPQAFDLKNILIFSAIVIISVIANFFGFASIKGEKVNNLEPARIMNPLFIVLLAILFSFINPDLYERDFAVIIPALIAGIALIISHIKKHHLKFNKYFKFAIYAAFLYALEMVLSKLILDLYSPISFYFLRCAAIFIVSYIVFRPQMKGLSKKAELQVLAIAALWVGYRVLIYYGFIYLGVIFTTLLSMLGPIFVYSFARIFLKEKINWKNIAASGVILLCIAYVTLF